MSPHQGLLWILVLSTLGCSHGLKFFFFTPIKDGTPPCLSRYEIVYSGEEVQLGNKTSLSKGFQAVLPEYVENKEACEGAVFVSSGKLTEDEEKFFTANGKGLLVSPSYFSNPLGEERNGSEGFSQHTIWESELKVDDFRGGIAVGGLGKAHEGTVVINGDPTGTRHPGDKEEDCEFQLPCIVVIVLLAVLLIGAIGGFVFCFHVNRKHRKECPVQGRNDGVGGGRKGTGSQHLGGADAAQSPSDGSKGAGGSKRADGNQNNQNGNPDENKDSEGPDTDGGDTAAGTPTVKTPTARTPSKNAGGGGVGGGMKNFFKKLTSNTRGDANSRRAKGREGTRTDGGKGKGRDTMVTAEENVADGGGSRGGARLPSQKQDPMVTAEEKVDNRVSGMLPAGATQNTTEASQNRSRETVKTEHGKSIAPKSGGGASPFSQTVDDVPEKEVKSMHLKRF